MGKNEFEFVDGIRVLPAGFDVEKAERAIDFFLNVSTPRTHMTFQHIGEAILDALCDFVQWKHIGMALV